MDEFGEPATRDNTLPITEEEFIEGMWYSVAIGLYYCFNAFLPIIAWYGWRKDAILGMSNNIMYKAAWYTLYPLHWFVFTPMAILWPFTYTGSSLVLEFYNLANLYLGSFVAVGVYALVAFMWLLATLFYKQSTVIVRRQVF